MAAETDQFKKPDRLVPMANYTMDEAQIMYDYCGIVVEDFAPLMDEANDAERAAQLEERLKNPAFVRALLHISYQQANPRASDQDIRKWLGGMNRTEALERFNDIVGELEEDEAIPPVQTTEPDESSPRSSVTNSESSGSPSTTSSDEPADQDGTTGTSESVTSSPPSLEPTAAP